MSYLNVRQLLPCARTAEVCQDLFGHRPSAGSVVLAVVQCAAGLAPAVDEIRDQLTEVPVLHADEPSAARQPAAGCPEGEQREANRHPLHWQNPLAPRR